VLRLLQDLSTTNEALPTDYWLTDIEEGSYLKQGGEAEIFKGFYSRNSERLEVIIRKYSPKPELDILKVQNFWILPLGHRWIFTRFWLCRTFVGKR